MKIQLQIACLVVWGFYVQKIRCQTNILQVSGHFGIILNGGNYLLAMGVIVVVNSMYWISDLVFAATLMIIYAHDKYSIKEANKLEQAFRTLILWVIFFCLQDAFWGIAASDLINNNTILMASSTVFHLSTVIAAYMWLKYVLAYMGIDIRRPEIYVNLVRLIIVIQVILLAVNFFQPTIFYVDENGLYCTAYLRFWAFMNQYIVYLVIGIRSGLSALSKTNLLKKRYATICAISSAPILTGVFQYVFPEAPYYSIGYFLGVVTIHIFVIMDDRDEIQQLKNNNRQIESELKIAEQTIIANTDKMTGCNNRRAYESEISRLLEKPLPENLVYVSADVNGLKVVNDTMGHAAGDELLKGAAECLNNAMGDYGKVFRMGGDEFAAIIYANESELTAIKHTLDKRMFTWSGTMVESLAISVGFVARWEDHNMTFQEMEKLADQRMYQNKQEYYASKGIDRRGQQVAYEALCASYQKILKINITNDSCKVISMDDDEYKTQYGFSDKISDWFYGFGKAGTIHPGDIAQYMRHTDIENLRSYFSSGMHTASIFYRRKIANSDKWHRVMMEMMRAEDYREDNQSLYLFVKDIER